MSNRVVIPSKAALDHRLRYRFNLLRAKTQGFFSGNSGLSLLQLMARPTENWPLEGFASIRNRDADLRWNEFHTPLGSFWAPEEDRDSLVSTAIEILCGVYELGGAKIRHGDTVFDLGGNLGTFTRLALSRGAGKVIVVEAHPTYRSCIERTFAPEIQAGRVIVVGDAVWSEKKTVFFTGGHLVGHIAGDGEAGGIEMETVTLDEIVKRLGLGRIDYLKADIEGAERHALEGGQALIGRWRPKIAFCIYHYPDDPEVICGILSRLQPTYQLLTESSGRYVYAW